MPRPICTSEDKEDTRLAVFLTKWPIERLETMTLDEYSRNQAQNPDNYKESFCYALERLTPGGIGGSNSSKFHIWSKVNKAKPVRLSHPVMDNGTHCWLPEYGRTAEEAYLKIRSEIVNIAKAARKGDLAKVESANLRQMMKWKIAFLYQDPANPSVVGCFTREPLESYFNATSSTSTPDLHRRAIAEAAPEESMQDIGYRIWLDSQETEGTNHVNEDKPLQGYGAAEDTSLEISNKPTAMTRDKHYPTDNPRAHYWLYPVSKEGSPGDLAELQREGVMLSEYKPDAPYHDIESDNANTSDWMAMAFAKLVQAGDVIVAYDPVAKKLVGVGIASGEYSYRPERERHARHSRPVDWIPNSGMSDRSVSWTMKMLTSMSSSDVKKWGWEGAMGELMDAVGLPRPTSFLPYPWSALGDINLSQAKLTMKWTLDGTKPTLRILYGPPGTGKTYSTADQVFELCLEEVPTGKKKRVAVINELKVRGNIEFVTFHQNYDYADFVEGYRPSTKDGKMTYEMRDGVLKKIARRAERFPGQPFILIIDEINRGNISKIFGELITLIEADKRLGADNELRVTLPFSGESFCLPRNLSIIGTMNTADRSIALLDTALRRRFNFRRMDPDASHVWDKPVEEVDLQGLLRALNAKLTTKFGQDHQIGHAWFPLRYRKPEEAPDAEEVLAVMNDKILPLLDEWYYDEPREKAALLELLTERGTVTMAKLAAFAKTAA